MRGWGEGSRVPSSPGYCRLSSREFVGEVRHGSCHVLGQELKSSQLLRMKSSWPNLRRSVRRRKCVALLADDIEVGRGRTVVE
jgi:hypothetical protein